MKQFPEWIAMLLKLAGISTAFWGLTFALFPDILFRWANLPLPVYFFTWKMLGIVGVVFGVFYFLAAFNPRQHTMVICMGLLIQLIEFIFVLQYWQQDIFTLKLLLLFVAKDFIWIFPLAISLYYVFRFNYPSTASPSEQPPWPEVLANTLTVAGHSLKALSDEQAVLLIFLRHFGCASCHETLKEIRDKRQLIEAERVQMVFVHMAPPEEAMVHLKLYGLQDTEHISDSHCRLYAIFGLKRAGWKRRFDMMFREPPTSLPARYGMQNATSGDRFRLPGVFLIYREEILKRYQYEQLGEQADFIALASHQER